MLLTSFTEAQTSKTINVVIPGTLSSLLTTTEKSTVSNLTVTGNIDVRDIKCMRDVITKLAVLDISTVKIKAYYGSQGTYPASYSYPANEMPVCSFYNISGTSNTTLKTITIGDSITSIGSLAFKNCTNLTSITISNSVTSIKYDAFSNTTWYNNQPNGLIYINNLLYKYKGTMPSGTSIAINNGTTTICDNAFESCIGLASLTLPVQLKYIGRSAFNNCVGSAVGARKF